MPIDGPSIATSAFCGVVGGAGLCLVGHPFDTVKLKMQTASQGGVVAAVKDIMRADGVLGFYRGVESPLCLQMVFRAWLFVWFEIASGFTSNCFVAGAMTGVAACVVESPMLLLMNQAQAYRQSVPTRLRVMLQASGLRCLTQGMRATAIRNAPSNAFYLGGFTYLRDDQQWPVFAAGAVGGLGYWVFT